jgi:fumarate hydratase class II
MTSGTRKENEMDGLGQANVPADKLWGAQAQRSLEHFSIGKDLIAGNDRGLRDLSRPTRPEESGGQCKSSGKQFDSRIHNLIVQVRA